MKTNNANKTTSKAIPIPIPAFAPEERPPVGLGSFASDKLVSVAEGARTVVVPVGGRFTVSASAVEVMTLVEVTPVAPNVMTDVMIVDGCGSCIVDEDWSLSVTDPITTVEMGDGVAIPLSK
jgi:hypothetical protein